MNMNDRILENPPRAADGYAQGCAWCVIVGWLVLVGIAVLRAAGGV